jgi:hypothetical protein
VTRRRPSGGREPDASRSHCILGRGIPGDPHGASPGGLNRPGFSGDSFS